MHNMANGIMVGTLFGIAVSTAAADKLVVGLMGDSTVCEYKPEDKIYGWGQCLGEFLEDTEIINGAVGGLSTKTCLERGKLETLLAKRPNYVLIQFGHNDSHAKERPESTDAATDSAEDDRHVPDGRSHSGAGHPHASRTFDKNGKASQELKPYAEAMKDVAKEKDVFLVDLHTSSGALFDHLGDANSADLSCKADDRTHFSEKGAREMARLVAEGLTRENGKLAKHLKTGI